MACHRYDAVFLTTEGGMDMYSAVDMNAHVLFVLSCHSDDVDVFRLLLNCAFGGFPLHVPIRL